MRLFQTSIITLMLCCHVMTQPQRTTQQNFVLNPDFFVFRYSPQQGQYSQMFQQGSIQNWRSQFNYAIEISSPMDFRHLLQADIIHRHLGTYICVIRAQREQIIVQKNLELPAGKYLLGMSAWGTDLLGNGRTTLKLKISALRVTIPMEITVQLTKEEQKVWVDFELGSPFNIATLSISIELGTHSVILGITDVRINRYQEQYQPQIPMQPIVEQKPVFGRTFKAKLVQAGRSRSASRQRMSVGSGLPFKQSSVSSADDDWRGYSTDRRGQSVDRNPFGYQPCLNQKKSSRDGSSERGRSSFDPRSYFPGLGFGDERGRSRVRSSKGDNSRRGGGEQSESRDSDRDGNIGGPRRSFGDRDQGRSRLYSGQGESFKDRDQDRSRGSKKQRNPFEGFEGKGSNQREAKPSSAVGSPSPPSPPPLGTEDRSPPPSPPLGTEDRSSPLSLVAIGSPPSSPPPQRSGDGSPPPLGAEGGFLPPLGADDRSPPPLGAEGGSPSIIGFLTQSRKKYAELIKFNYIQNGRFSWPHFQVKKRLRVTGDMVYKWRIITEGWIVSGKEQNPLFPCDRAFAFQPNLLLMSISQQFKIDRFGTYRVLFLYSKIGASKGKGNMLIHVNSFKLGNIALAQLQDVRYYEFDESVICEKGSFTFKLSGMNIRGGQDFGVMVSDILFINARQMGGYHPLTASNFSTPPKVDAGSQALPPERGRDTSGSAASGSSSSSRFEKLISSSGQSYLYTQTMVKMKSSLVIVDVENPAGEPPFSSLADHNLIVNGQFEKPPFSDENRHRVDSMTAAPWRIMNRGYSVFCKAQNKHFSCHRGFGFFNRMAVDLKQQFIVTVAGEYLIRFIYNTPTASEGSGKLYFYLNSQELWVVQRRNIDVKKANMFKAKIHLPEGDYCLSMTGLNFKNLQSGIMVSEVVVGLSQKILHGNKAQGAVIKRKYTSRFMT